MQQQQTSQEEGDGSSLDGMVWRWFGPCARLRPSTPRATCLPDDTSSIFERQQALVVARKAVRSKGLVRALERALERELLTRLKQLIDRHQAWQAKGQSLCQSQCKTVLSNLRHPIVGPPKQKENS